MNIYIVLFSLAALSECSPNVGNILPITTTTTTTDKYERAILKEFMKNLEKIIGPDPTSSTQAEKKEKKNNETSSATEEITDELIASVLKEPGSEAPSLASLHEEISTPSYSTTLAPTTRSTKSPQPVSTITKPPVTRSSNKKISSYPSHDELDSFYQFASQFSDPQQHKQPSAQQKNKLSSTQQKHTSRSAQQQPQSPSSFNYNPQNIPLPYNPSSFHDQQDWTQPVISQDEFLYYPPPYLPMYPVPYQSFLIPQEQPQSSQNNPLINYGSVPFAPLYANSNPYFDPSQDLPYSYQPPQTNGAPGHFVSSYVRSYIPQQQFQPSQFQSAQPSVSFQPSPYMPIQLSEKDIMSLIQEFEALYGVSPGSLNAPSSPVHSYSTQPNHASGGYKSSAPLVYYR